MDIDFESFADNDGSVSESNLEFLAKQATRLAELNNEMERIKTAEKQVQMEIKRITEEVIPNYMRELGLSEIKLANGAKVSVKDQIFASIKKENQHLAFKWLRDNGHDSLIKNEFKINFGKGEDERASTLKKILEDAGYDFKEKEEVHWQTLRAFVREQLENGVQLPEEAFSVHVVPTAVIK